MPKHYREATMLNRKMWKMYRKYLVFILFIIVGACASAPSPPVASEKSFFKRSPSDADLVYTGMSYLGNNEQAADYIKARAVFSELLKTYPRSKWKGFSEALIRLIDDMHSSIKKAQTDKAKILRENEHIKKDNRQLLEETAKLVQENEQLRKDIQLLKSLEVQQQKREKMLR